MSRDVLVGNGALLVNFDMYHLVRDIYFPHIGQENHVCGNVCRIGAWAEGMFSWLGREWELSGGYMEETLVSELRAKNQRLEIELLISDAVDFHENILIRKVCVKNLTDRYRDVRLFFHHDLGISEHEAGDTAFFEPKLRSLIHYKKDRYFLINGRTAYRTGISQYATGRKNHGEIEGTWRDAEDGQLQGNPIAHGAIDSTVGFDIDIGARGRETLYYWMCVGTNYKEVNTLHQVISSKTAEELLKRTGCYWNLWVNKEEYNYGNLPANVVRVFKRSLLSLRTHVDSNGAIIAGSDSDILQYAPDSYCYMWPRDGALAAYALDKTGYTDITRSFFYFCKKVLADDGYFLNKYYPDGSPGSSWHPSVVGSDQGLPIQEDATALVVWSLWYHFNRFRALEFIKPLYRDLIIKAAEFMMRFRDQRTKLPLPSYDLWGEKLGIHTFTCAAVSAGLKAAGMFANAFGEKEAANQYFRAAEEIKEGMVRFLFDRQLNRFARGASLKKDGNLDLDKVVDASLYGLFAFGVLAPDDPMVVSTMDAVAKQLWVKTPIGGVARYEGDRYLNVEDDFAKVPGNPWFVCTLWLAQWEIAKAKSWTDLKRAFPYINWVVEHAAPSGIIGEQISPYTGELVSVSPLTWSHATFILTIKEYMEKMEELVRCQTCGRPAYRHDRMGRVQGRTLLCEKEHEQAALEAQSVPAQA